MNAVGELGNLIVQYQRIIEIALLSIFGIMILFFVIRAFVRSRKKKNVLDNISHTVENISETVSEIKEKQDSLKADFHRENMGPVPVDLGNTGVTPENCEISKRIMQECDKIDSYMADLAARMNIKEEHIEKLQQIQIDQFVNKENEEQESLKAVAEEPVSEVVSKPEAEMEPVIEEAIPELYDFEADAIDDDLWKEDVQGKEEVARPREVTNHQFVEEERPHVATACGAETVTLSPRGASDLDEAGSDEDQPLQTVEEILAQCAKGSGVSAEPREKSRFKENWDDDAHPSYTFERPEGTVKEGQYARHAEMILEEERAKERALEEARRAEIERAREEARRQEIARQQEEARRKEFARRQEEARRAELARKQEEARRAELAKQQEEARRAELARQRSMEREAQIARQQQGLPRTNRRIAEPQETKQFTPEEAALIRQGAKRFDFTMELPKMDQASLGSDKKQAAKDFLNSFGSTLSEGTTLQGGREASGQVAAGQVASENHEFVGREKENPFVEAFDKMAEKKSVIEPRMNHEEEAVSSMDSGIPPKKYFSTDCATDKFGKSYTEEELKNQIN